MRCKPLVLCSVFFACASTLVAQSLRPLFPQPGATPPLATEPPPLRLATALAIAPIHSLRAANIAALDSLEAMQARNAARREPPQNGFARPLPLPAEVKLDAAAVGHADPVGNSGGLIADAGDGMVAWGTRVHVDDADRLRLHMLAVQLAPGARMWVWGVGQKPREFGLELRAPAGDLWTPSVAGPDLMVEVQAPSGGATSFTVNEVMELFQLSSPAVVPGSAPAASPLLPPATQSMSAMPQGGQPTPAADSSSCLLDATCAPSSSVLTSLHYGVAQLQFIENSAGFLCSGGLLNNTKQDGTPYLLTAHHCFSTQASASSLEAFWQYADPSCNAVAPSENNFPRTSGATLLATSATSDFTFIRLLGSVPGTSVFLGWDASSSALTSGESLYRVSYPAPAGIPLPQGYSVTHFLSESSSECFGANHIYSKVVAGQGDTAGGSSGSPVALASGQVVGQLHGQCLATASSNNCDPGNLIADGAFSQTFSSIEQWLSPAGGGAPCVASSSVLCIDDKPGDKRFAVHTTVNTAEDGGLHGPAADIALASLGIDQGGIFWFFAANNPEMLIKVLNGCSLGGHYWVFFAALTNVGFSVTVTDTQTGNFKTYSNPDQTTAQPVQDTAALPCT